MSGRHDPEAHESDEGSPCFRRRECRTREGHESAPALAPIVASVHDAFDRLFRNAGIFEAHRLRIRRDARDRSRDTGEPPIQSPGSSSAR